MTDNTSPGAVADATAPGSRSRRISLIVLLFAVSAVIYISDQLTKNWVVTHLPEGEPVPVLGDFLQWYFVRNPGAAFSFASGATWVFTIFSAVVIGVIIWQMKHIGSRWWAVFLGLLLGGVLGNLTDRLTREPGFPVGHVIDFISTPWMMPAIYNIADMGIVVGMVLFVTITLFGIPIDGSPRETRASRAAAAAAAGAAGAAAEDTADAQASVHDVTRSTENSAGIERRTVSED